MSFKKISIFSSITILFSVLFSIGVITLVSFSFIRSEYAINNLAERLMSSVSNYVKQEFRLLIEPTDNYFQIVDALIKSNNQLSIQSKEIQHTLLNYVRTYPNLANVYLALPDGSFLMATHANPVKLLEINTNQNTTTTRYFDDFNREIKKTKVNQIEFNPLLRPWFLGAIQQSQTIVSDIYTFFESQKLGVTLSKTVRNNEDKIIAVLGVDLSLDNLQTFLNNIDISDRTFVAIIDKQKQTYVISRENDGLNKNKLDIIKMFFQIITEEKVDQIEFNNEQHYFKDSDVGSHFFSNWKYVIAIPETELINEILIMRKQSLIVGGIILSIGCIIIFLFSRLFSEPIKEISNQANKIKKLEKVASLKLMSPVEEVSELIQSINALGIAFDSFVQYVPKTIVKHLLDNKQKAMISGGMYDVTILFTDIEGFTAFSDKEDPEKVSLYLSRYFEILSEQVVAFVGTIDKYIGDSLMVFWGAPNKMQNHAIQAVKCVLAIKQVLESDLVKKDPILSTFKTRFGLHSGQAVIGNIGSTERINYTAIGRDVNICSRLEALNKEFGTYILLSDHTQKAVSNFVVTRPLEPVLLKGLKKKIAVHELMPSENDKSYLLNYNRYISLYLKKKYKEAGKGFRSLLKNQPNDNVVRYFLNKIEMLEGS